MRKILYAVASLISSSALATPLEFNGWNAQTTLSTAQEGVTRCDEITASFTDCNLNRTTIGGLLLRGSIVSFVKPSGRISLVEFSPMAATADDAVEIFAAKYGKPAKDTTIKKVNRTGGPYEERSVVWHFDNGDQIEIYQGDDNLQVDVRWSENFPPVEKPKVDF